MKFGDNAHKKSSSHLPQRLLALFVSILIALASGTPYLYGVYSPQLVKRIGLTTSDSATISLATNLGSSVGGLPGGLLIDHFGPQFSIFVGSICIFVGYFSVFKIYQHRFNHLSVICIAMVFAGFGSITSYFATLKAAQANFTKHKGVAGAFPVSCYGFAATIFSIISATYFNDNAGGLLEFLAFFCGAVTFFGSFFIHIYVNDEDDDDDVEEALASLPSVNNYQQVLQGPSQRTPQLPPPPPSSASASASIIEEQTSLLADIQPPAQSMTKTDSLTGSLAVWGIGERTPRSSISLQESEASSIVQNLRNGEPNKIKSKAKLQNPYHTIKERLTHKIFLIHYFIVSVASGIGQMYIFSVGFIVTAQYYYNKKNNDEAHVGGHLQPRVSMTSHDPEAASLQALQVSIISIASFSGRLLAGFLSDFIHKKWHVQRLWIVLFTLVLLAVSLYLTIINVSSFELTSVVSAMIGGSYGLIFGTYPAIIADSFGTMTFSTNWGLVCTGPLFILYILNKYFGWIYDSNTDKDTGTCFLGNRCYMGAFELSLGLCIVCFFVTLLLLYMSRRK
ncbi:hypothetical protein KGF56_001600 [Candida oxycetoniae]|uniref:Nodulin-like domain-containing protein n=1 Tax=Candida oxycetoniae TaxID=497107 RepID=A0AAI9SZE1_9ASCO|nr:uncharacterized protein KGF56_001600 [Candida oxycetoniae]KAI3405582.2 hypothetical protein KGF56_001600 [Candida oxycetoniae]